MLTSIASVALGTLAVLSAPNATPSSSAGGEHWMADFDKAVEVAKSEHKDLLVDFTGSDWCIWCKRLDAEVFSQDAFLPAAEKNFVLVALDFPNSEEAKAKVPNPDRNQELSEKYHIEGFPTVLLMNPDGEVYAQTGYRAGGVDGWLENLEKIRSSGREALVSTKTLVSEFAAAQGDAKKAAWDKVMELYGKLDNDSPFAAQLADAVAWGMEADPDNAKGMKMQAVKALLEKGQTDQKILDAATDLDPDNAQGLLEKVVDAQFSNVSDDASAKEALDALDSLAAKGFKDKELAYQLHFTAARWCAGPLKDPEGLKRHAAAAKEIGTDNKEMADYLDKLLQG